MPDITNTNSEDFHFTGNRSSIKARERFAPPEPFIQAAVKWFFRRRPLQVQLFNGLREDAEELGIHTRGGGAGVLRWRGAGSCNEPNSSSVSEAAIDILSSSASSSLPPKDTMLLA
ncbi:hypothetical protein Q8A67_023897 [Cirrhinus molitorella]|uniref:Uncharacterized protein n=1 Tax=Cirrhinus molitorella TaxID=172907 RepID=A0AA88TAM3_9TELE|nr:hypothetical protein Q8A67_023897 [Cirrhinus molitorella]